MSPCCMISARCASSLRFPTRNDYTEEGQLISPIVIGCEMMIELKDQGNRRISARPRQRCATVSWPITANTNSAHPKKPAIIEAAASTLPTTPMPRCTFSRKPSCEPLWATAGSATRASPLHQRQKDHHLRLTSEITFLELKAGTKLALRRRTVHLTCEKRDGVDRRTVHLTGEERDRTDRHIDFDG